MHFLTRLAAVVIVSLIGQAAAHPVLTVTPGGAGDLVPTSNTTVNATAPAPESSSSPSGGQLQLSLVNNFGNGNINAYVTGLDASGQLVLLQPDGSWYYPSADGATTPQAITANVAIALKPEGQTTELTLPSYISSGRVWFAAGSLQFFVVAGPTGGPSLVEPSSVNPSDPSAAIDWGFVELTYTEDGGLYANISYVDFVGLPLGMSLTGSYGTQTAMGVRATAIASICNDLATQSKQDGQPWGDLCIQDSSGKPLRVIAPGDYISVNSDAFSGYFDDYIEQVWWQYASEPLCINTQAAAGDVNCTVSGDTLNCDGDNRGYSKPTASDIFGCNSGPFAIEAGDNNVHQAVVPRLCAAFDRTTLLLGGGNTQPSLGSTSYYTCEPTNWYSAIVHKYEIDGKGYAFAYDDVNPDGDTNQSGVVSDPEPDVLTITIGGPVYSD